MVIQKHIYPNQLGRNTTKGVISEFIDGEKFCNIVITVGHENTRPVSFTAKKEQFEEYKKRHVIGDRVTCKFYLASNSKNGKWFTNALILSIDFD